MSKGRKHNRRRKMACAVCRGRGRVWVNGHRRACRACSWHS